MCVHVCACRHPHHAYVCVSCPCIPVQVRTFHHIMGGVVDPHAAYLLLRGLKTLELRVDRHNQSALTIARRLEKHPKVDRVWYPGERYSLPHGPSGSNLPVLPGKWVLLVLKVQYTLEPQLRALGLFGFLGTMQQCSMFALHALTCTPLLRAADADMCRFAFT